MSGAYTELTFAWPQDLRRPLPGQFLTVGFPVDGRVFLRRPFSLSGFDRKHSLARILIQPRGPGSESLCRLQPGEPLDLLGPRGFPFPYQGRRQGPVRYVLAGGGIGVGPLLFAAQYLREKGEEGVLCLGFRESRMIPHLRAAAEERHRVACESGSLPEGVRRGTVLDLVREVLAEEGPPAEIWACGPPGMLRALAVLAHSAGVHCHVLMEEMMACAVGACQGCAVPVTDGRGYLRACTEGPVFDAALVDWERLWT